MPGINTYKMWMVESEELSAPDCADKIIRILFSPGSGVPLRSFIPGQFVKLGVPGSKTPTPAYFAIASSPFYPHGYEFVIKCGSPMADYLAGLAPGSPVEVEGPMGKGFDLSPYRGCDVVLMGVGTGIAPLRSLWQWLIEHREDFGKVRIYAGFLTAMHLLLTDEMAGLSEHQIDVSVSLATGHEGWDGPIGYVQHALEDDAPDGSHAVACLAGMSAMVDACKQTLQNLGFDDRRILLNF